MSAADAQPVLPLEGSGACINMESVNRIAKLPVVESTIQTATNIYEKVKDYNSVTNWTFQTAEDTVHKAVEVGKPIVAPVVHRLEHPIKKVDDLLCTGLDYVESKVPAVKLPPGEILLQMYNTTKDLVNSTVTPVVETAATYMRPAVDTARHIVEPALNKVEPYIQPALETANAVKEYGTHKVEELLHLNSASAAEPQLQETPVNPQSQEEMDLQENSISTPSEEGESAEVDCKDCKESSATAATTTAAAATPKGDHLHKE